MSRALVARQFRNVLLAAIALLGLPAALLQAADSAGSPSNPDVLAMILPQSADSADFATVISETLRYRLVTEGLELAVQVVVDDVTPTNDALIRRGRSARAEAVIICRFSVAAGRMTTSMSWTDLRDGKSVSVPQADAAVDLSLDSFVLQHLDALLSQVQDRIDQLAADRKKAQAAASAAATQGSDAGTQSQQVQAAAPPQTVENPEDIKPRPFLISAGIAPFIPVGTASTYFSLGYMTAVAASFVFQMPIGGLGAGMTLGVLSFATNAGTTPLTGFILPLGLDARYIFGGESVFGLQLHISGGAAVIVVSSSATGTLAKTVPYARGAVGIDLRFSRSVGLALDVGYDVYFEMPLLVMGVSPILSLDLRL